MSKSKKSSAKRAVETTTDPDRVPLSAIMKKPGKAPRRAKTTKAAGETEPATDAKPEALMKDRKPSGLDTAFQVLKDAGTPMRCGELVQKMISGGLWQTNGKTPASTIYSAILREISVKGEQARFKKTDRGHFVAVAGK